MQKQIVNDVGNWQIFGQGTSTRVLLPKRYFAFALFYVLHSAVGGATLASWHPLGYQSDFRGSEVLLVLHRHTSVLTPLYHLSSSTASLDEANLRRLLG